MKHRKIFRVCAMFYLGVILFPLPSSAQRLPSMSKSPWIGFFSAYERRNFEFGINNEGQCELYLISAKKKSRVGHSRIVKIYAEVHAVDAEGKVSVKRLKEDEGYSTEMKAGLDHEQVKFSAESTGDAKVEITVKYDRGKIVMDGKLLDPGKLKGEKYYLVFKVLVPAMYGRTYASADKNKIKAAMRKDRIKFVRATDRKRVSLKSYEEAELSKDDMAKGGVTELVVSMEGLEGNDFIFTTIDGSGVLDFENTSRAEKGPLWKGYIVKWKREFIKPDAAGGAKNAPRKASQKGISPFVFEVK